ncbi:hypothetical protein Mame_04571 (plasmid) [Martelella mediterranea DSM 17316]|uniref:Uncharacterized protein n=1 Tax=Martelella mediterranea DSM 17316 TaxID=1122214 RepID=A0A1U9Z817_9HYPH|nr:hypothetical protein Mame_04571 [Martelella mediterranea DSM 17316]
MIGDAGFGFSTRSFREVGDIEEANARCDLKPAGAADHKRARNAGRDHGAEQLFRIECAEHDRTDDGIMARENFCRGIRGLDIALDRFGPLERLDPSDRPCDCGDVVTAVNEFGVQTLTIWFDPSTSQKSGTPISRNPSAMHFRLTAKAPSER